MKPEQLKGKIFRNPHGLSGSGDFFKEEHIRVAVQWLKEEFNAKRAVAFTQDSCGMRMMKQRKDLIKSFNEMIDNAFEDVIEK